MRRSFLSLALAGGCLFSSSAGCGARPALSELTSGAWDEGAGGAAGGGSGSGSGAGSSGTAAGSGVGATSGPGAGSGAGTGSNGSGGDSGVGSGSGSGNGTGTGNGSGTGTGSGTGAGNGSSGSGGNICPSFGDECTDCLSNACPETYCNCYDNDDCFALATCADECNGDESCAQDCMSQFQSGISDYYLLTSCAGAACNAACPGNEAFDPCQECIFSSCDDEANACLAQSDCLELYYCLEDCGPVGLSCQQQCYADHSDGVPSLETLLTCSDTECQDPCG